MAAHASMGGAQEVHHTVPQCLLNLRDRADAHQEFDGEGIQLWLDYELEALLYGVDPAVSREELAALVEGSTVLLPREEHRSGQQSDFAQWGGPGRGPGPWDHGGGGWYPPPPPPPAYGYGYGGYNGYNQGPPCIGGPLGFLQFCP